MAPPPPSRPSTSPIRAPMPSGPRAIMRLLLNRQVGGSPGQHAPGQVDGLVEAGLLKCPDRFAAPPAAPTDDDDVSVAWQLCQMPGQDAEWDEARAAHVSSRVLVRLTDV